MNRECTDLEFNLNPPIELYQLAFIPFKFNLLASFTRGISGGLSQFRDFAIISLNFRYSLSPLLWGLPSFVNFTRSSFKPESHPWPPSTSLYSPSLVISAQSARTSPTLGRVTLQSLYSALKGPYRYLTNLVMRRLNSDHTTNGQLPL
jgi:hypothetical protein